MLDRTPVGIFLRVSFSFDVMKPSLAQQHGHHIADVAQSLDESSIDCIHASSGSDSHHVDRTLVGAESPPRLKEHSNILIGCHKAISGAEVL